MLAMLSMSVFSASTKAQVVVVADLPNTNVIHRAFAAGVVQQLKKHWDFMQPGLSLAAISDCDARFECLQSEVRALHGSHLLLISAAGLSEREYLVSLRFVDVRTGEEQANASEVLPMTTTAFEDGKHMARRELEALPGVPSLRDRPPLAHPTASTVRVQNYGGLSPLSATGWGLVATGVTALVIGGVVNVVQTLVQVSAIPPPVERTNTVALSVAVASATVGLGLVSVDAFVPHPSPLADD